MKQANLDNSGTCLIKKNPKKKLRPSCSFDVTKEMNPSILKSSKKRKSGTKKSKKTLKHRRKSDEEAEKVTQNSVFKPSDADLTPSKIEFAKIDSEIKFTAKKESKKTKVSELVDQIDMTPYKDIKLTMNQLNTVEKQACNGKIDHLKNLFDKGSKKINALVVSYLKFMIFVQSNYSILNFKGKTSKKKIPRVSDPKSIEKRKKRLSCSKIKSKRKSANGVKTFITENLISKKKLDKLTEVTKTLMQAPKIEDKKLINNAQKLENLASKCEVLKKQNSNASQAKKPAKDFISLNKMKLQTPITRNREIISKVVNQSVNLSMSQSINKGNSNKSLFYQPPKTVQTKNVYKVS